MSHLKKELRFFDPAKTFEINKELVVTTQDISPGVRVVVIDNFYEHPELVEELILNTPVASQTVIYRTGYTGYRVWSDMTIQNLEIFPRVTQVLKEHLGLDKYLTDDQVLTTKNRCLVANIYTDDINDTNTNRRHYPHWDDSLVSAFVYFYDTVNMGTSLYRHTPSSLTHCTLSEAQGRVAANELGITYEAYSTIIDTHIESIQADQLTPDGHMLTGSTLEYEKIYGILPKYNRFVAFIGSTLHSPDVDYDYMKDTGTVRINQVMFLDPVTRRF